MRYLLLLLTCLSAFGQAFTMQDQAFLGNAVAVAAPAGCTTVVATNGGSTASIYNVAQYTTSAMFASCTNIIAYSGTICRVDYRVLRVGSGTAPNFWAEVRTNDISTGTNYPGAVVATSDNVATSADVGGTEQWVTFTFTPGISIAAGGTYWYGLKATNASAANYYQWRCGDFGSGWSARADINGSWTNAPSRRNHYFVLFTSGSWPPVYYTNSFELLSSFETGSAGDMVTGAVISSAGIARSPMTFTPYTEGSNATTGGTSNRFTISSIGASSFPSNYWWTNGAQTDSSTRAVAINFGIDANDTNGSAMGWNFPVGASNISWGMYYVNNLTNTSDQRSADLIYFKREVGQNYSLTYRRDNGGYYYPHGSSNGVTINGPGIYGCTLGNTNYITGLISNGTMTLAIYNPATWAQIGSNVSLQYQPETTAITPIYFNSYLEPKEYLPFTNYMDNFVISTNCEFPLLPTNFPAQKHVQ